MAHGCSSGPYDVCIPQMSLYIVIAYLGSYSSYEQHLDLDVHCYFWEFGVGRTRQEMKRNYHFIHVPQISHLCINKASFWPFTDDVSMNRVGTEY